VFNEESEVVNWIQLAQGTVHWRILVNMVMKLLVS